MFYWAQLPDHGRQQALPGSLLQLWACFGKAAMPSVVQRLACFAAEEGACSSSSISSMVLSSPPLRYL